MISARTSRMINVIWNKASVIDGKMIARHIIESFDCTYNGREIFRAKLHPAVSTNPFFTFYAVASESGEFVFTWKDDQGGVATTTSHLDVT